MKINIAELFPKISKNEQMEESKKLIYIIFEEEYVEDKGIIKEINKIDIKKSVNKLTKRKLQIMEEGEKIEEEEENKKLYFVYYNDTEEENKFFKERINYVGISNHSWRRGDEHGLWSGNFCITYSKRKAKIIETALINYFAEQLINEKENPILLKDRCICSECKRVHIKK